MDFRIASSETMIITVESTEHYLHKDSDIYMKTLGGFSVLLIAILNGYLLYFIYQQKKKTFLDWLIVLDCILCLSNCLTITGHQSNPKD